jgi:RND family efflux transporter MFP subunit
MKNITSIIIIIGIFVLIGLKLKTNKEIVKNRIYIYNKEKPIKVFTQKIEKKPIEIKQQFTGSFEAEKEVRVNADVQGGITKFYVDEGTKVKKGQPLVKLDESLLQTQLNQINVQIETLKKDLNRYIILADADAIPGIKLEKVQQGLKTAESKKQSILIKIKKTIVRAPFGGIVTKKFQEVGAFAAPGVPLLMLTNIGDLKFTINVPESNIKLFQKGKEFPIQVDAYPDLKLKGKIIRVGNKGNMSNNFPIQFSIKNTSKNKIKAKMFGRVLIEEKGKINAIIIPAKAIVGSEIQPQVYKIIDGKAKLTTIVIGNRFEDRVVVSKGLNQGDIIVTSGFINLFDGANVTTNKEIK